MFTLIHTYLVEIFWQNFFLKYCHGKKIASKSSEIFGYNKGEVTE